MRFGQGHKTPDIHSLSVDHEFDDAAVDRLHRKRALHETTFDGQDELHDDNGLAGLVRKHIAAKRESA